MQSANEELMHQNKGKEEEIRLLIEKMEVYKQNKD